MFIFGYQQKIHFLFQKGRWTYSLNEPDHLLQHLYGAIFMIPLYSPRSNQTVKYLCPFIRRDNIFCYDGCCSGLSKAKQKYKYYFSYSGWRSSNNNNKNLKIIQFTNTFRFSTKIYKFVIWSLWVFESLSYMFCSIHLTHSTVPPTWGLVNTKATVQYRIFDLSSMQVVHPMPSVCVHRLKPQT